MVVPAAVVDEGVTMGVTVPVPTLGEDVAIADAVGRMDVLVSADGTGLLVGEAVAVPVAVKEAVREDELAGLAVKVPVFVGVGVDVLGAVTMIVKVSVLLHPPGLV
jgi:hypothetical protein